MRQEDTWDDEFARQVEVACMHGWHLLLWGMNLFFPHLFFSQCCLILCSRKALTQPQHPQVSSTNPQHLWSTTNLPQPHLLLLSAIRAPAAQHPWESRDVPQGEEGKLATRTEMVPQGGQGFSPTWC